MIRYSYQSEKMSSARRALMLPHTGGEARSIMEAFRSCDAAFGDLDESGLDADVLEWIVAIKKLMDTTGIEDLKEEGTYLIRARQLSADDQLELSRCVDELAHWFAREKLSQ